MSLVLFFPRRPPEVFTETPARSLILVANVLPEQIAESPQSTITLVAGASTDFPIVQDADTQTGIQGTNSNNWTLTYPTNIAEGDLVCAFMGLDGAPTVEFPIAWNEVRHFVNGTSCTLIFAFKRADGTESGTFGVTVGPTAEQGAWRTIRITGAHATTDPANGTAATGNGNDPDPPSFDPAGWDVEDTLWFAALAADDGRTNVTDFPIYYTNGFSDASGGGAGASLGTSRRNNRTVEENPSAFTIDRTVDWVAQTFAIRPAPAFGGKTFTENRNQSLTLSGNVETSLTISASDTLALAASVDILPLYTETPSTTAALLSNAEESQELSANVTGVVIPTVVDALTLDETLNPQLTFVESSVANTVLTDLPTTTVIVSGSVDTVGLSTETFSVPTLLLSNTEESLSLNETTTITGVLVVSVTDNLISPSQVYEETPDAQLSLIVSVGVDFTLVESIAVTFSATEEDLLTLVDGGSIAFVISGTVADVIPRRAVVTWIEFQIPAPLAAQVYTETPSLSFVLTGAVVATTIRNEATVGAIALSPAVGVAAVSKEISTGAVVLVLSSVESTVTTELSSITAVLVPAGDVASISEDTGNTTVILSATSIESLLVAELPTTTAGASTASTDNSVITNIPSLIAVFTPVGDTVGLSEEVGSATVILSAFGVEYLDVVELPTVATVLISDADSAVLSTDIVEITAVFDLSSSDVFGANIFDETVDSVAVFSLTAEDVATLRDAPDETVVLVASIGDLVSLFESPIHILLLSGATDVAVTTSENTAVAVVFVGVADDTGILDDTTTEIAVFTLDATDELLAVDAATIIVVFDPSSLDVIGANIFDETVVGQVVFTVASVDATIIQDTLSLPLVVSTDTTIGLVEVISVAITVVVTDVETTISDDTLVGVFVLDSSVDDVSVNIFQETIDGIIAFALSEADRSIEADRPTETFSIALDTLHQAIGTDQPTEILSLVLDAPHQTSFFDVGATTVVLDSLTNIAIKETVGATLFLIATAGESVSVFEVPSEIFSAPTNTTDASTLLNVLGITAILSTLSGDEGILSIAADDTFVLVTTETDVFLPKLAAVPGHFVRKVFDRQGTVVFERPQALLRKRPPTQVLGRGDVH